jgi:guanine deaminase
MRTNSQATLKAFRAPILDFVGDPFYLSVSQSVRYFADGFLAIENGKVKELGDYDRLHSKYPDLPITTYDDKLILPGFIDTHLHFPQTEMIAAYGTQLLEWLEKYTFPTESKFKNRAYAQSVASFFIHELLRNGTTTAVVLATVHPESVDAFFEESNRLNLRMIAGKVMMDRNAPDFLTDTAESSYYESKQLIEKWHHYGRSLYAITPRFAPTSTPEQLKLAGKLLQEFPGVYLHTHLSENVQEVAWVKELFPECQGYVDVYDRAGLVGERSIFAHGVQLTDKEFQRLSEAKSTIAYCPTSNLFLGSGLFNLEKAKSREYPVKLGLATDVGGGTSFSMFQTAGEAYKIAQLRQQKLSAFQAMYLATLGGAQALCLDNTIGNFDPGKEADFIVVDFKSTPILNFRNSLPLTDSLEDLADHLFSLVIMGDDRAIQATYIMGDLVYDRENPN